MDTLLLDPDTWDLKLDKAGNIALATGPAALAQDAASAIRTFKGEVYYDTEMGIPYFSLILGKSPPAELLRAQFTAAALTVPGIVNAKVAFTGASGRGISGQVQVSDVSGTITAARF